MIKDHPKHYHELRKVMGAMIKDMPDTMKGFSTLNQAALKEGALSSKTKELIALGIAIYAKCDGCIAYHIHDALDARASREEIEETIGVSILIGGGPAVVYGCEAMVALGQFEKEFAWPDHFSLLYSELGMVAVLDACLDSRQTTHQSLKDSKASVRIIMLSPEIS